MTYILWSSNWCLLVALICLRITVAIDRNIYRDRSNHNEELLSLATPNSRLCVTNGPQNSLNIEQIMGQWYGNEIIMHTPDAPGVYNYHTCVLVHIDDWTEQMRSVNVRRSQYSQQHQTDYYYGGSSKPDTLSPTGVNAPRQQDETFLYTKYLRLVWTEQPGDLEYTLNYTDFSPGVWTNVGDQRGSLSLKSYTQFSGSVQVIKAVNDHLVLTFCSTNPESTIYSIVLSRNIDGLSSEKIIGVRKLLWHRGLAVDSIRKLCVTSSAAARTMTESLRIMGFLVWILKYFLKAIKKVP